MKNLNSNIVEYKWIDIWKQNKYFLPNFSFKDRYCIVIPPPNITGRLHIGHAFQCTLMDILIRYYKMNKISILWKFGCDHAGIATQILLEQKFKSIDIKVNKKKLYKWQKKSINKIKKQINDLAFLVNWDTGRFTLDNHFSYAVRVAFIKLYEEKLIYKATKLVNWDMKLRTAISDLETIYKSVTTKLYYIKYQIFNSSNFLVVATTRPETIFADVAIAVNSYDFRYNKFMGLNILVPIIDKFIPLIFDNDVDLTFGTGCLKITPGHDFNDFEIGNRHNLNVINIFTIDGFLNDNVPEEFRGLSILDAREKVIYKLQQLGAILKIEDYETKIPLGDRSGSVIEPFLTTQFYINVKPLIDPVQKVFDSNKIKIIPFKWKNIFIDWIKNIKDWCISRQIWWGHRIPLWYDDKNNSYLGHHEKHIIKKYSLNKHVFLRQESDVLDTWFSSALWPFASLGWPNRKIEFTEFYPTNTLITGFDIIFFWVIRMMMFGLKFTGVIPFNEIYVHGLIRDIHGAKMSKTKGNVIDPMDVIKKISQNNVIKEKKIIDYNNYFYGQNKNTYGVDALRLTFASIATNNISLKIDLKKIEIFKKFCNKLLNASNFLNFVKSYEFLFINKQFKYFLYNYYIFFIWQKVKNNIVSNIIKRNFYLSINYIYRFFWNEFCDWYIEITKVFLKFNRYTHLIKINIFNIFKEFILILHPFAPIITADIWHTHFGENILDFNYPVCLKNRLSNIYLKYVNFLKFLVTIIRKNKSFLFFEKKKVLVFLVDYNIFFIFEKIFFILKAVLNITTFTIFIKNIVNETYLFDCNNGVYFLLKDTIKGNFSIDLRKKIDKLIKDISILKNTLNNKNFLLKADKKIIKYKKNQLINFRNDLKLLQDKL